MGRHGPDINHRPNKRSELLLQEEDKDRREEGGEQTIGKSETVGTGKMFQTSITGPTLT